MYYLWGRPSFPEKDCRTGNGGQRQQPVEDDTGVAGVVGYQRFAGAAGGHAGFGGPHRIERGLSENKDVVDYRAAGRFGPADLWGDRIFEKCGIGRDEGGDGGKTLEIRGKRRLSARDGGANYQQS